MPTHSPRRRTTLVAICAAGLLSACATTEPVGSATPQTLWALTQGHQLLKFNGGQPQRVLERKPLSGLGAGESVVGMDYRVAKGVLYALTDAGRLYTVDTATGVAKPVGGPLAGLRGRHFGVDFNPTVDRIRVVSDQGQNWRLHPDTGALASSDPDLSYDSSDVKAGVVPRVAAAAYTYNTRNDKITTNFAIDMALGHLLVQGTREGVESAVSPNTGRLFTVGPLGTGPLTSVSFDISDVGNVALAAVTTAAEPRTQLYQVNLASGQAQRVGTVGAGEALRGLAIEP